MQTLHSVITDGHHLAADAAAGTIRCRFSVVSDQWNAIWHNISRQQKAVDVAVGLWQQYRMCLVRLRSSLTQIGEVVSANCVHDRASVSMQHTQLIQLQVRIC